MLLFCCCCVVGLDPPQPTPDLPKISRFFSSPALIFDLFLSLSLGVFSWNFGGVFEASGPSNVHVWALGLSCETLAASGSATICVCQWPMSVRSAALERDSGHNGYKIRFSRTALITRVPNSISVFQSVKGGVHRAALRVPLQQKLATCFRWEPTLPRRGKLSACSHS